MGCLRKKNQTYIFDEQGSVIITTAAAFKKLKEKRFFSWFFDSKLNYFFNFVLQLKMFEKKKSN